jgi:hypothetical protein
MVSQWCHSGVTAVSQWCHSGVTVVLQWCYLAASCRSGTGCRRDRRTHCQSKKQWCNSGVTDGMGIKVGLRLGFRNLSLGLRQNVSGLVQVGHQRLQFKSFQFK